MHYDEMKAKSARLAEVRDEMEKMRLRMAELRNERDTLRVELGRANTEKFYAPDDDRFTDEGYSYTSRGEAVEAYIDRLEADGDEANPNSEIVLIEFSRNVITPPLYAAESALENLLETLDEEGAGENPTDPTDDMKAIAEAFVRDITDRYTPFWCEPTGDTYTEVLGDFMGLREI